MGAKYKKRVEPSRIFKRIQRVRVVRDDFAVENPFLEQKLEREHTAGNFIPVHQLVKTFFGKPMRHNYIVRLIYLASTKKKQPSLTQRRRLVICCRYGLALPKDFVKNRYFQSRRCALTEFFMRAPAIAGGVSARRIHPLRAVRVSPPHCANAAIYGSANHARRRAGSSGRIRGRAVFVSPDGSFRSCGGCRRRRPRAAPSYRAYARIHPRHSQAANRIRAAAMWKCRPRCAV